MLHPRLPFKVINTDLHDLTTIEWLFKQAIAYQTQKGTPGWGKIDMDYICTEIAKKLQYKIVNKDGMTLCIFSVCYNDSAIWREKETGSSIYLHRITVNPKFKGQKQFAKVLAWAINHAIENNLESIRIDTWAHNHEIIQYYQQFGFEFVEHYTTTNSNDLPAQHRNVDLSLFEYKISSTVKTPQHLELI